MTQPSAAVQVSDLSRRFGERWALRGIGFEVWPAEIIGLVGPNGSGKTTLLKTLAGLLRPTSGSVRLFGLSPFAQQAQVMTRVRFAFSPPALVPTLTPLEHLLYLAELRPPGVPCVSKPDLERALALVGLSARAHDRVQTLSFGMRQRLTLAQALVPQPDLLVLDEPTDGLDPLAIDELRRLLLHLRDAAGTAILLASHLLVQVEQLVDRLVVLSEGRSLFCGRPAELTDARACIRIETSDSPSALTVLQGHGMRATLAPGGRHIEVEANGLRLGDARQMLFAHGIELASFCAHRPTLESALLDMLSRSVVRSEQP